MTAPIIQRPFATLAEAEDLMASAWSHGLRGRAVDRDMEYWKAGVNVNRAIEIVRYIWLKTGLDFPSNVFVESQTINRMAARLFDGSAFEPQLMVTMRDGDSSPPLFLFAGGSGLLMEFTDFVRHIVYPGAIYGVPMLGMDLRTPFSTSVEEEAARTVELIRKVQPNGAYRLIGYSSGGCVALEAARTLRQQGAHVQYLGLLDTGLTDHVWPFSVWLAYMFPEGLRAIAKRLKRPPAVAGDGRESSPAPAILPPRRGTRYEFRFRNPYRPDYHLYVPYWRGDLTPRDGLTRQHGLVAWGRYRPAPYDGPVTFYAAKGVNPFAVAPIKYWPRHLTRLEWVPVSGTHLSMMVGRYAADLTAQITAKLTSL